MSYQVFVAWSGGLSRRVAEVLSTCLPHLVDADFRVSTHDIPLGAMWSGEIFEALRNSDFGIVVVTRDNRRSPWLWFEAGALAVLERNQGVAPLYFGVAQEEVEGPSHVVLQGHDLNREGVVALVTTLHKVLKLPAGAVRERVELAWPGIEQKLLVAAELATEPAVRAEDVTEQLNRIEESLERIARAARVELPGRHTTPSPRPPEDLEVVHTV